MKNRTIQSVRTLVLMMAFVLISTACNPVGFDKLNTTDAPIMASIDPSEPPVAPSEIILPPVMNGPILSKGTCAADSSTRLLSCMNCRVPQLPVVSQFSKKGEAFFEIMTAACQIPNKSDPAGYKSPTRAELLYRLNRLSPALYPDTLMTSIQVSTIDSLRTNPDALKKFFGGVFYSGVNDPTIAFETYFGIESREARYSFCYAREGTSAVGEFGLMFTRTNSSTIKSKAYMDCYYRDGAQCKETPAYDAANIYRNQLRAAMTESLINPYVPVQKGTQQTCIWEKFQGIVGEAADAQVKSWLALGFTVGADIAARRVCMQVTAPLDTSIDSFIDMAAYRCK